MRFLHRCTDRKLPMIIAIMVQTEPVAIPDKKLHGIETSEKYITTLTLKPA